MLRPVARARLGGPHGCLGLVARARVGDEETPLFLRLAVSGSGFLRIPLGQLTTVSGVSVPLG